MRSSISTVGVDPLASNRSSQESRIARAILRLVTGSAEQTDGAVGLLALDGGGELDGDYDVDEFAEALLVERPGRTLGEVGCGQFGGAHV